jgi:hypothetical protein
VLCGGSFDRALWTRSSIFCIRLRRLFIWWSDSERAMTPEFVRSRGVFKDLTSEGAVLLTPEMIEGTLVCLADTALEPASADRGVAARSGMSDADRFAGGSMCGSILICTGASESGGDGGVSVLEAVSDFGGGVDAVGDVGVAVLISLPGLLVRKLFTARVLGLPDRRDSIVASARRSFSSRMSCSTFKSPNSSRKRCASILSLSLSCSPILISSSIKTPRSIATFSFDSRSSILLDVFLAWRSKSSFATSISLSFRVRPRCCSRIVVISFCNVFCALFASAFACLCFVFHSSTSKFNFSTCSLSLRSFFSAASTSFSSCSSSSLLEA